MRLPLVLLVCLTVLGPGCGGDDGDPTSTPLAGGLGLELQSDPSPPVSGKSVVWTLTVENNGVEAVELTFGSSQRADVILRKSERQVYKWSADRFFTTALEEVRLLPNRTLRIELEAGSLKVKPGRYDLEARLTAKPAQQPLRRSIEVR